MRRGDKITAVLVVNTCPLCTPVTGIAAAGETGGKRETEFYWLLTHEFCSQRVGSQREGENDEKGARFQQDRKNDSTAGKKGSRGERGQKMAAEWGMAVFCSVSNSFLEWHECGSRDEGRSCLPRCSPALRLLHRGRRLASCVHHAPRRQPITFQHDTSKGTCLTHSHTHTGRQNTGRYVPFPLNQNDISRQISDRREEWT